MNRIDKSLHAIENMLQPLKEITFNSNYEIVNGFIKVLIKRKNRFYILTDRGDLIKFSTKSEKDLEGFLNLLYQYDELIYKSIFNGEVFEVWLRKASISKVQNCRIISMDQFKRVA